MISDKILSKFYIIGIVIAFSTCVAAIFHVFPKFENMWEIAIVGWFTALFAISLRFIKFWENSDDNM